MFFIAIEVIIFSIARDITLVVFLSVSVTLIRSGA